ncbi:MAG: DUF1015 domain-containing protein [Candidatus Omnitrophota bacterium]
MAKIFPFCGLRYNQDKVKNIDKVFSPPYDIISEQEQKAFYKQHPCNVVRLVLGKTSFKDNPRNNRYLRAAGFLNEWIKERTLIFDAKPCIYLYIQEYKVEGEKKRRLGFIARMRLDNKDRCLPHEHTLVKPKEDRMLLMRSTAANLSPIFSFFLDAKKETKRILSPFFKSRPLLDIKDKDKVRHCFWKIEDEKTQGKIAKLMKSKQVFIADGHHRYEVALAYRDEMLALGGKSGKFNYIMIYFTPFSEDSLTVLPTHRMVKAVGTVADKIKRLERYFKIVPVKTLPGLLKLQNRQTVFSLGMFYKNKFWLLKIKNTRLLAYLMRKAPKHWRKLDVAVLNNIIFGHIFKFTAAQREDNVGYTRNPRFAAACVKRGEFAAAFFLNPTKAGQVKKIALSRKRMPQKSTYFYPKPLTGLVINKF